MSSFLVEFTDEDFQSDVLHANGTVLVDFWAAWCGPCRLMAPLMVWASETYRESLVIGKIQADNNPKTFDAFKIHGIPTIILFRGGEVIARHEGSIDKSKLTVFLDEHL